MISPRKWQHRHMMKTIPSIFVFIFPLLFPTAIISCSWVFIKKMTASITSSEEFMASKRLISASYFLSLLILFISIMYHISILFETFIVFILMLFVHVYYTIISFSWQIIITTILFIGITFVIYLM